ncbi:hypothetical protein MRX96_037375 [Rhipicephalus microplus]
MQLVDAGYQITQTQGGSASSNDLLPNLQNLSAQLNDVLARLQSTQPENNAPASAPTNGNEAHSSSSTNALPQQPYRTDQQSAQPLMLTTSSGYPPLHHSSASPQQERRHPHSGGDTLSYHVHTHIPPLPLLPPSIASVLKHNSPPKQLPGGLARFEPPEKDLGAAPHHSNSAKSTALGCYYPPPPGHIAPSQLPGFDDPFLTYLNPFPRPLYPRHPYISDEEPVRDTGIDLRKRSQEASSDSHSSGARPLSPISNEMCSPIEKNSHMHEPHSDPSCNAAGGQDGHHEDQCDEEPADEPVHCVEPMSEGFEVSPDAGAETQTEVSEEIDVDGSSRGPSPANEEAAIVGAVSGCAVSASCVIGSSSAPASTMTSAVSSPRTTAASLAQQTPDHPPSAENSTSFETPENTGVPPLPSRFPDPDSPRAILSEARSLLPSLTTPVKAIRFDPERFYSPRRKSLIPRRRLLAGFSPSSKPAADSGNTNSSTEESREFSALLDELVHNYPFVAKLAENINQAVVGPDGTYNEGTAFRLEPIAEETPTDTGDMLTSQESTMPESLIKEILNKTENDPVFEAALAQICDKLDTTNEVHGVLVTPSKSSSKSRQRKENCSPKTPSHSRRTQSQPTTPQLMSLFTTPRKSANRSPHKSPQNSPRRSAHSSPNVSPHRSPQRSQHSSPSISPHVLMHRYPTTSPNAYSNLSSSASPNLSPNVSQNALPNVLPNVSPSKPSNVSPNVSPHILPEIALSATPPRRSPRINARNCKQAQHPPPSAATRGSTESTESSTQSKMSLGTQAKPKSIPQTAKVAPVNQSTNEAAPMQHPAEVPSKLPLPPLPTNKSPFKVPQEPTTFRVPVSLPLKSLIKEAAACVPKVVQSPPKPTVQVVSKATENGETVTCISIPDPPGSSPPKQCMTLADVIDSVLSPERRQALSQTERSLIGKRLPATLRPPIVIMSDGTQVMLCTNDSVTSEPQTLAPSSMLANSAASSISNIIYPNVMVTGMPQLGSFSIVMPNVPMSSNCQFITMNGSTTTVMAQGRAPVAKKRLPLLQPREPLPSQPSPPSAFKEVEDPKYRYLMGNRLRNAKRMREMTKHGASLQQNGQGQSIATTSNSATSQPFTSAASSLNAGRQQHSTAKPQTPPGASQRLSNEKSPQLKSLVAVASKCTTSQNHVRVLDFGNVSSELTQDSSEGASNEASSERVVKAIESIRTSLTGAVNKVLRNSSGGITGPECWGKAKKAKNEEYLKSMDVNKFLDKIHSS